MINTAGKTVKKHGTHSGSEKEEPLGEGTHEDPQCNGGQSQTQKADGGDRRDPEFRRDKKIDDEVYSMLGLIQPIARMPEATQDQLRI